MDKKWTKNGPNCTKNVNIGQNDKIRQKMNEINK